MDCIEASSIPSRSKQAIPDLIDLIDIYTSAFALARLGVHGIDLFSLASGVQAYDCSAFEIRCIIQLAGTSGSVAPTGHFPREARIPIGLRGKRVHSLHACAFSSAEGASLGANRMHYADGSFADAPIVKGRNITDRWDPLSLGPEGLAVEAWRGSSYAIRARGVETHLIRSTWISPEPAETLTSLDFISHLAPSAPF